MQSHFEKIIGQFAIDGTLVSCARYGEGHINETYLVVMDDNGKQTRFILQKINHKVFRDVEKLMNNIRLVTEYNRQKIVQRGGNPDRESLSLVYTKTGASY